MVDYMNARGNCPKCGEFMGWTYNPPHKCSATTSPLEDAISYLKEKIPPMETAEKFKMIYQEILDELQRALVQYPSFHSGHEGWAMIKEELDELWTAVMLKQSTPGRSSQMYSEAKQVAAMAIRFMLDMPGFKN